MGAPAAASIGVPLLLGAIQGKEEERNLEAFNRGQAELTRFSDITGRQGKLQRGTGGGAVGGALRGGLAGAQFAGGAGFFKGPTTGLEDLGGPDFVSGRKTHPGQFFTGGFGGPENHRKSFSVFNGLNA